MTHVLLFPLLNVLYFIVVVVVVVVAVATVTVHNTLCIRVSECCHGHQVLTVMYV